MMLASVGIDVALISLAVGATAGILGAVLAPRAKGGSPIRDSGIQPTKTQRGEIIPLVIGRRRIAPFVAWVSDPFPEPSVESRGGGKRQATPDIRQGQRWLARGIHHLCVSPGTRIDEIVINGKNFSVGGLSVDSHRSGQAFRLVAKDDLNIGTARVYWGAASDPLSPIVSGKVTNPPFSNGLGLETRFPLVVRIEFDPIKLGSTKQWPQIEYDVTAPVMSFLKQTPPWRNPSFTRLVANMRNYAQVFGGKIGKRAVLTQQGSPQNPLDLPGEWKVGHVVILSGTAAMQFFGATPVYCYIYGAESPGLNGGQKVFIGERVGPETALVGPISAPRGDQIGALPSHENDGVNPAHTLSQLMFAPRPWGAGLNTKWFDLSTLERVGVLMESEQFAGHMVLADGETFGEAAERVMRDIGVMVGLNPRTGKHEFRAVREEPTPVGIPSTLLLDPLPERDTNHTPGQTTDWFFSFPDRRLRFRSGTYPVDDDGAQIRSGARSAKTVPIETTTHFDTARDIALRRFQEGVNQSRVRLVGQREIRFLTPGMVVQVSSIKPVLRVTAVERSTITGKAVATCLIDHYGQPASFNADALESGADAYLPSVQPGIIDQPRPDAQVVVAEANCAVSPGLPAKLAVFRVPHNEHSLDASVWISADNLSYTRALDDLPPGWGGTLASALSATETGALDVAAVGLQTLPQALTEDLSGSPAQHAAGKQLVMIGDGQSYEIVYVRSLSVGTGVTFTLNGLIRGEGGTAAKAWPAGSRVSFLRFADLALVANRLIKDGATIFVKVQPRNATTEVSLAEIEPVEITLAGLSVAPLPPVNLSDATGTRSFHIASASGTTITWDYLAKAGPANKTAGGYQPAGAPTGTTPDEYDYVLRVFQTGTGTVQRTVPVGHAVRQWHYSDAAIQADFGGHPADFEVEVSSVLFNKSAASAKQKYVGV